MDIFIGLLVLIIVIGAVIQTIVKVKREGIKAALKEKPSALDNEDYSNPSSIWWSDSLDGKD